MPYNSWDRLQFNHAEMNKWNKALEHLDVPLDELEKVAADAWIIIILSSDGVKL